MKTFLYTLFLLTNFIVFSNHSLTQTNSIFIQIDTIVTYDKYETLMNFEVEQTYSSQVSKVVDSLKTEKSSYKLKEFPNFIGTLNIDSDSSKLRFPIDKNGSHIILDNVHKYDTIHFHKIKYFSTQPPDTNFITKLFFKLKNGKRNSVPDSSNRDVKIKKLKSPPNGIIYNINGVEYYCKLEIVKKPHYSIINGHGYNPKNPYKRNGDFKKRVTRIEIASNQVSYYWIGIIKLK